MCMFDTVIRCSLAEILTDRSLHTTHNNEILEALGPAPSESFGLFKEVILAFQGRGI